MRKQIIVMGCIFLIFLSVPVLATKERNLCETTNVSIVFEEVTPDSAEEKFIFLALEYKPKAADRITRIYPLVKYIETTTTPENSSFGAGVTSIETTYCKKTPQGKMKLIGVRDEYYNASGALGTSYVERRNGKTLTRFSKGYHEDYLSTFHLEKILIIPHALVNASDLAIQAEFLEAFSDLKRSKTFRQSKEGMFTLESFDYPTLTYTIKEESSEIVYTFQNGQFIGP